MEEKIEIIQTGIDIYQSEEKAAIDIQIATAKAYPRDIIRSTNDAIAIVAMNKETAESCNQQCCCEFFPEGQRRRR